MDPCTKSLVAYFAKWDGSWREIWDSGFRDHIWASAERSTHLFGADPAFVMLDVSLMLNGLRCTTTVQL